MAEYTNDLRIKEIGIGEEAGAWGTTLNTQLGLLAEGFSYGVENLGSDANATITMADGASDEARSLYLKITSTSLSATRTVTLAPQSVSKVWIIENATTGSQSITITQGEGQHGVTIPNGQVKIVYSTGDSESPSGVYDALDNLELGGAATAATSVTAPLIEGSTSIQTPLIEYTDGDDAITIADGGGITAANGITSTAAANTFGATSFNDADITNVGSISLDSIVSDTSPGAIQINSGGDKLRIDGTVGIGTDAHDTQALHILSSTRHIRLENAGSPGEIGLIGLLENGQLDIWAHGDNSTDIITFRTGSSTGTERVRIANTGNVGIGDSSPFSKLHVEDTSWSSGSPYGAVAYIQGGDVNDLNWGHLLISQSGTTTDTGGRLSFGANGENPIAGIRTKYKGATYGDLAFLTRPSGGTNTERMLIQSTGITQFKTGDGNSGIAEFHTNASTGNATSYISIRPQGTARGYLGNGSSLLSGADDSDFILRSEGSLILNSNGNNERIRVRSDGNVGIGSVGMPSNTSYTQLSIGPMAHIMAEHTSGASRSLHISQNAHLDTDSSWETMETDEASNYYQHGGGHYFRVATSTSAGTDITWKTAMYVNSSGHLIIGASDHADDTLYLIRSGTGKLLRFYSGSTEVGYIGTNGANTSLPSDRNFKKDINDLNLGLDLVKSLNPKTFRLKIEENDSPLSTGLIAQEIEESLTEAGIAKNSLALLQHKPSEDAEQSQYWINNESVIPILINAIKEQQTFIETLQAEVKTLKGE